MLKKIRSSMMLVTALSFVISASETDSSATDSSAFTLSQNMMSVRGLNQIYSGESLGEGRLSFTLSSSWYSQDKEFSNSPNEGADIVSGMFSVAFGVSQFFDIYASLSGFKIGGYSRDAEDGGIGTFRGGIGARLPLPDDVPVFLGARVSILGGTSNNQINTNAADGYNYFETRTGYDFEGVLMQSFRIGKEGKCVKFHLNEGAVVTLQESKDNLFLLGGGFQVDPHRAITIAVEASSRTSLENMKMSTDPLMITPLLQFHTPVHLDFSIGSNISLSKDRSNKTRALEPFRLFAGLGLSFDVLASKRKAQHEKEIQEKAAREDERRQRELAEQKNRELIAKADSIVQKAKNDSLQLVKQREIEKLRADSLAAKTKTDSIALIEANNKLKEEKSKRTDAEKQLLSTGLLLLDAVYFESGKAEISINSEPYLMIISKMLLKYPKLQVEVAGHTDNVGNVSKNQLLSQNRAEAVRFFLVQSSPELANRLTARGYGSLRPKANNAFAEGRKVNRRVELQVLNKEVLSEYNK